MQNKKILRASSKEKRKTLNIQDLSEKIRKNIKSLDEYKKADNILLFYPINEEIDIVKLLDESRQFYLPRVNSDKKTISIYSYSKNTTLIKNSWGIPEPDINTSTQISPSNLDMVIIPALMADKKGYRLGYGGGFYDRFLPLLSKNCKKIIPIPQVLLCEELPHEAHDQAADYIITEKDIFQINA